MTSHPAALPGRSPVGLVLPFTLIGFAGSALVADLLFGGAGGIAKSESAQVAAIVVVTVTAMCALLGRALRQPVGTGIFANGLVLAAAVAFAGVASGGSAALLAGFLAPGFVPVPTFSLVPAGGVLGLTLAPVFWMPLAAVFFTRRASSDARRGSILAGTERRRVWVVTGFVIAIGAGAAAAGFPTSQGLRAILIALAATGALGALTVAEGLVLRGVLTLARGLERIAEPRDVPADAEVDLGIGDERWMAGVTRDAPYRGVGRAERSVRGAVFDVQGRLAKAVLIDGGLFATALLLVLMVVAHRPAPPPAPIVMPSPMPASTLPVAGVRWLSWYPLSPPLLVDINGDGREDIIGLRWNAGQEAHALSVTATDGATLAPLWQSTPIACQWANPQVRLVRSGDRLFLTDSERLIHLYDLRTGREIDHALGMPENTTLQCADRETETDPRVWLRTFPTPTSGGSGYLLDAKGIQPAPTEPKWCAQPAGHPPCGKESGASTCQTWGDYKLSAMASKFAERYSLREGDAAVAIGFRRTKDASIDTLVGYDPKTRKARWDQPVARDLDAHAFPRIQIELAEGKVFTFYQERTGDWQLAARDARTGEAEWSTQPPRALEGTNFDSLTITTQGVYLGLSNRLEVFDPATGGSRGVVW